MELYLAAPFFNPEQLKVQKKIEYLCMAFARTFFSPRIECLCPPDASLEQRAEAFRKNLKHIDNCDMVFARIDDFDSGTMWELGYAFAKGKPSYAYTIFPQRGLNLMLAQSGLGLVAGWPDIERFLARDKKIAKFWVKEII